MGGAVERVEASAGTHDDYKEFDLFEETYKQTTVDESSKP